MYAGVKDVRMLNGGFYAWQKAKCMTQATPDEPASIPLFTSNKETKPKSKFLATTAQVLEVVQGKASGIIVDIRKESEYNGSVKDNYKFFESAGHIPKAVLSGNWDDLCDKETGLLKDLDETKKHWESLGITHDKQLIFYCGTGWRSSIAFFISYLLGW